MSKILMDFRSRFYSILQRTGSHPSGHGRAPEMDEMGGPKSFHLLRRRPGSCPRGEMGDRK